MKHQVFIRIILKEADWHIIAYLISQPIFSGPGFHVGLDSPSQSHEYCVNGRQRMSERGNRDHMLHAAYYDFAALVIMCKIARQGQT